MTIVVSKYNTINGNVTNRRFRKIRVFEDETQMEKERKRLEHLYGEQVTFSDRTEVPDEEVDNFVKTLQ